METALVVVLLGFLIVIALGIIFVREVLAGVILLGIYSLVAAGAFVVMDAVDVAFTEAAVGAGVSTILYLGAMSATNWRPRVNRSESLPALAFVVLTGALLIWGTLDMPHYGDPDAPAQTHPGVAVRYIEASGEEVGIPNIVTSVLASYRGFDTLGETVVVFTAGIAVVAILGLRRRRPGAAPPLADGGAGAGTGAGAGEAPGSGKRP